MVCVLQPNLNRKHKKVIAAERIGGIEKKSEEQGIFALVSFNKFLTKYRTENYFVFQMFNSCKPMLQLILWLSPWRIRFLLTLVRYIWLKLPDWFWHAVQECALSREITNIQRVFPEKKSIKFERVDVFISISFNACMLTAQWVLGSMNTEICE